MSPIILWLFFTLDKIIVGFNYLTWLSVIYLAIIVVISLIGGACVQEERNYSPTVYWNFCKGVGICTKKYTILAIVLISVGVVVKMFLPNTKEAIAIVVVPKVIDYAKNSKELNRIPDNLIKMTNTFMEQKIKKWTETIPKDSTKASTVAIDSQIVQLSKKLQELNKIKESAQKIIE